ncbi:DUF2214 family protein [Jeongeupia sp. USM3]|uniref:DUF2214 family protein n=1 Tax=Jeongeupia sp. USM3 TaxID=1906741 RepID=UPI00089E0519|nr:DUF2214 family protein [Jeongeupia sp. USM3]AOX99623.1 hypothetical protein BJP62_03625 [Jeongeupia sp. USM3]
MLIDAILAAAHYLAIFMVITFLSIETVLVRREWMPTAAARLARYDMLYFMMAMLALATGLGRLFYGIKGAEFYLHNPVFHTKLTVFVLIGLISIYPTRRFLAWRKAAAADAAFVPPDVELVRVRRCLMWETHLIVLLPILAVLMARGFGLR